MYQSSFKWSIRPLRNIFKNINASIDHFTFARKLHISDHVIILLRIVRTFVQIFTHEESTPKGSITSGLEWAQQTMKVMRYITCSFYYRLVNPSLCQIK